MQEFVVVENGVELDVNELEIEAEVGAEKPEEDRVLYFCSVCSSLERHVFHIKSDREFAGVRG